MRGFVCVQSGVVELAPEESLSELWRPWEILGRYILRSRLVPIAHRRGLEERIAYIECVVRVDNIVALISEHFRREYLRVSFGFLNDLLLFLDIIVHKDIKLASFAHRLQHFVLVRQL